MAIAAVRVTTTGFAERHRLEENGRRAGVAVVANRQCDDPRPPEPVAHLVERQIGLDGDVRRSLAERARVLGGRDDDEARVGQRAGDGEQELEVPVRVRSDGDDIEVG